MSETPPDHTTDASPADAGTDRPRITDVDDPLPPAFRTIAGDLLAAAPGTLREFFERGTSTVAPGDGLAVDQLCHAEDGDHVARTADETYRFHCFFDGVVLAGLADAAVTVETTDPTTGEAVTIEATPDGRHADGTETDGERPLTATTDDAAVVSFGIAPAADVDDPAPGDLYGVLCPYVNAFASPATYAEWAAGVDAPTVAVAFDDAVELGRHLVA